MESGCWNFFELFLCVVETGLFRFFIMRFGKRRGIGIPKEILCVAAASGAVYAIGFIKTPQWLLIFMALIVCMIEAVCLCRMKYIQYLVFSALYYLIVSIIDFLSAVSMQLILQVDVMSSLMQAGPSRFICAIISKLFLLLVMFLIIRKGKVQNEKIAFMSTCLVLLATSMSFLCLFCIICLEKINGFEMSSKEDIYICLIALGIFGIDILVYMMIKQLNDRINKEKRMEMVQYQNKLLEKMVLQNKEIEKEWRKNRHDFNNHLSCVDMLLQMENIPKARAYIHNLTQNYLGCTPVIRVGNEIADAIINQKYLLAAKKKIQMKVEGNLEEKLPIEQMDLCALLSNSLDNAIEAAVQIPEEEKRLIELNFRTFRSYLIIEVINSVKENVVCNEEKLKTTKKDQEHHGIGMASMQATVDKYKGHMEWSCKDCHFSLVILLPIKND